MFLCLVPELPLLESRNWLIHLHYSRKEFGICKILLQEELERSNGMCEYANYVQVGNYRKNFIERFTNIPET